MVLLRETSVSLAELPQALSFQCGALLFTCSFDEERDWDCTPDLPLGYAFLTRI